jgi:hypothetical protein
MPRSCFAVGAALLALSAGFCRAESIGPGKYSGIVVFDRWGGCMLYHGIGVLYISEAIKGELKDKAGKCIEVDATQVKQVLNDAMIKKLKVLGPAPSIPPGTQLAGVKLVVAPAFEAGHAPEFAIRVTNGSPKPMLLEMDRLGPTVLGKREIRQDAVGSIDVVDGPSRAVITSQSLWTFGTEQGGKPRLQIEGSDWQWKWQSTVTQPLTYERIVKLQPNESLEIRILFTLPAGEYEFLAGYGGNFGTGQCVASNLVAFDVKADGTANVVKVPGREPTAAADAAGPASRVFASCSMPIRGIRFTFRSRGANHRPASMR